MSFRCRALFIIFLLVCNLVFADEIIIDFKEDSIPVINESLRKNFHNLPEQNDEMDMGDHAIENVTDPTNAQDAATKNYVDSRGVIRIVNTQTGALDTGVTLLPYDNTTPQITEGDEYMTLAITPKSATNKLKIDVVAHVGLSTGQHITVALFQDATANALACSSQFESVSSYHWPMSFTHHMIAGTMNATTFRVRIGGNAVGTTTFNGQNGVAYFNGKLASSITITEYN